MPPIHLSPVASVSAQSANAGLQTPPARWHPVAAGAAGLQPETASPANPAVAATRAVPAPLSGLPARPGLQGMRRVVAASAPYAGPLLAGGGLYLAVAAQFARFGGGNGPAMPVDAYIAKTVAGGLMAGAGTALTAAGIWLTHGRNAVVAAPAGSPQAAVHPLHDEENTVPSTPVV